MRIIMEIDPIPYSNRELDMKFTDIMDTLNRIETQTTATNGKVAKVTVWKEQATGAGWAFGACLTVIIVPIAGLVLYNQFTEPIRIQQAVKDSVSSYFNQYDIRIQP